MTLFRYDEDNRQIRTYRFYTSLDKFEEIRCLKYDIQAKYVLFRDLKKSCVCYVFNTRRREWEFFFALNHGVPKFIYNCEEVFSDDYDCDFVKRRYRSYVEDYFTSALECPIPKPDSNLL